MNIVRLKANTRVCLLNCIESFLYKRLQFNSKKIHIFLRYISLPQNGIITEISFEKDFFFLTTFIKITRLS